MKMMSQRTAEKVNEGYRYASEVYASLGVDTDEVIKKLEKITISLHCWQGDDLTGFETGGAGMADGGILATGGYPGKARNGDELRADLEKALSLIPGKHRVNLHAVYAEAEGEAVDRDRLGPERFARWLSWAAELGIGMDFNPTFFSHRLASSGYTLSSKDEKVRRFWIEHGKRSREIGAHIGKTLGTPCVNNIWIPDGSKDMPSDRRGHRALLKESLDEILAQAYPSEHLADAVESKLFGIGSEAYVVGSHEFYMGYALSRKIMLCLDSGHFHPTESVADKISSILEYSERLLLHVSRGVRWDSDHVAVLNEDTVVLAQEVRRCDAFGRVHFALDFFDASINRITAWVTGARAALKAILFALLEPTELLRAEEDRGNLGNRLALMEELKTLPFGLVWDKYCLDSGAGAGASWLNAIKEYENKVLSKR